MKYHISEVTISADNASPLRLSLAIEKDYLILSQDAMEVEINHDELDIIAAQGKMLLRQFQETPPAKSDNDDELWDAYFNADNAHEGTIAQLRSVYKLGQDSMKAAQEEDCQNTQAAMAESPGSSMELQAYLDSIKVYGSASPPPPAPTGLLVERIRDELGHHETASASAVLLLVAKWLDGQIEIGAAHMLRQEAER